MFAAPALLGADVVVLVDDAAVRADNSLGRSPAHVGKVVASLFIVEARDRLKRQWNRLSLQPEARGHKPPKRCFVSHGQSNV